MSPLLSARDVSKSYGAHAVLKGISLDVVEGETFAVIGPNGAGKTTLFKVLTGEVPSNGGEVRFRGEDVTRIPAHERVREGMGRTFQVARVFPEFTPRINVIAAIEARMRARGEGATPWYRVAPSRATIAEADEHLESVGLAQARDQEAKFLSHGDKKRLELAVALATRPRILMLDEPTAGMSPSDRVASTELIARLRAEGRLTVLITEHDMGVIFGLASRILVMNQGEMIALGTIDEIRTNATVRDVYLGEELQDAHG